MTSRILPMEEWSKLQGTLLEHAWLDFDPVSTRVVVVEDGDKIVACVSLFAEWHLEGVWVSPEYRHRVSVGRRLLLGVKSLLERLGVHEVMMMAMNPESRRLCQKLGTATLLDCEHFAVRF